MSLDYLHGRHLKLCQMPFLREIARDVAADWQPTIRLVIKAKEVSYGMKPPELAFPRFIPQ